VIANSAAAQQTCVREPDRRMTSEQVRAVLDGTSSTALRAGLDLPGEQLPNAYAIVATGQRLGTPGRAQLVALAVALQESRLRNLNYGDADSLGLFQQRPSQGWGTADQIRDPVYASEKFFQQLLAVDGWQQLTLAQAAQAVQRSAHADAYAQWEPLATALLSALTKALPSRAAVPAPGGTGADPGSGCSSADGSGFGVIPEGSIPAGFVIPAGTNPRAREAITWAMRQLGTLYQWGGTCTAPRGPDPMARCDCSSLTQQAYAHAGVRLSRTTYTQVNEGVAVSLAVLRPGDLLFSRGTATRPDHVGMYLGEGLVIEAPRSGRPVRITALKNWTVLAARRVV
jgi:cell wall-associated NlpC family hydrolase